MPVPTKIVFDPGTNIYVQLGSVRVIETNGERFLSPEQWVTQHFANANGSVERAYHEAVRLGLVEDSPQGKLAWMDLKSQGGWMPGPNGTYVPRRPEDQYLTVRKLAAVEAEKMGMPIPPVPGVLVQRGITSWDEVV